MRPQTTSVAHGSFSKRLIASYILDWIVIIAIGVIAYVFSRIHPHYHAFSVLDLSISYPLHADTVPIWVVGVVAGIIPACIILVVSMLLVPGPSASRGKSWSYLFRMKVWEWNTGWLGLAMSLATALMITQGLKNFGKPRPNCLARCQPDIANIERYAVGGYGQDISQRWVLVTHEICQQPDQHTLDDGFQSWPSGHSTTAWAGLLYLTLYLCSKFAVVIPYLPSTAIENPASSQPSNYKQSENTDRLNINHPSSSETTNTRSGKTLTRRRDEAAAPPTYLLVMILVPCGGALYICLSRYMDYAHHGFDILSGSIIGIVTSWFSFRYYHLPIAQGSGWSWGPRSRSRAFAASVGEHGYVDEDRFAVRHLDDVEMEPMTTGSSQHGGLQKRWANVSEARTPLVGPALSRGQYQPYSSEAYSSDMSDQRIQQAPHAV